MFGKRPSRGQKRVRPVARDCGFCKTKTSPTYREVSMLTKYITERGKIMGQTKTGMCSKHQRAVTRAIKRARIAGLMSFVVRA